MVPGTSPDWLPPGFSEKVKVKDGRKYKVYTDSSTGSKFYSKPAVTRYLDAISQSNTVVEQAKVDNVEQPLMTDIFASPDGLGCIPEKKRKGEHTFETVTTASVSADGIPLGWIKETRTSKCGNKIRKDLFYIDPNNGYIFSSKKDVLRYLETNDISRCAIRPKKRELDVFQLTKNKYLSSSPLDEKLSKHLESSEEPSILVKLNDGDSSRKSPAAPEAKILVQTDDDISHIPEENKASENLNQVDPKKISFESANEGSDELRVTNPVLAMAESITKQELPPSEIDKQTNTGSVSSKNSKKRKGVNMPPRTSKRLAGYEPEVQNKIGTSERAFMAAAKRSSTSSIKTLPNSSPETAADVTLSSNVYSSKEATLKVIIENSLDVASENNENHQAGNQAVPDEKQVDDIARSLESHHRIEFSKSWSDPCLEFAFKTLTEEIPFEDTLAFSGCFGDKLAMSHNQSNNCLKPSESEGPRCFQKEILPCYESLKEKGSVSLLPASDTNFLRCGVSSQQSSTEKRMQVFPKLPESAIGKQTGNAEGSLRQSGKKNPLSFSSGVSVSKGFAGLGPKKLPNTVTGKQVPRTSLGSYAGPEAKSLQCSSVQTALEVSLPHRTNQSKERKTGAFVTQEILQKLELLNRSDKLPVENQAISDEKSANNCLKSQESHISYSFQNTWSDPCLDFAFKTLTGELPIEDSLAFSSHSGNQFGIPFNQANQYYKPPRTDTSIIYQGEIHHSDPSKLNRFVDKMPSNIVSFPNSSGASSQQSSSDMRNRDYLNMFSFRK